MTIAKVYRRITGSLTPLRRIKDSIVDKMYQNEAFALLDEIKQQTFHALVQIKREGDEK